MKFSQKIKKLQIQIDATQTHYARYLKLNNELRLHAFNSGIFANDLRCTRVLESVRISHVGYLHHAFVLHYGILVGEITDQTANVHARETNKLREHGASSTHAAIPKCEMLVHSVTEKSWIKLTRTSLNPIMMYCNGCILS